MLITHAQPSHFIIISRLLKYARTLQKCGSETGPCQQPCSTLHIIPRELHYITFEVCPLFSSVRNVIRISAQLF